VDRKLQIYVKDKGFRIGIEYIIMFTLLFCIFSSYFINSFNEVKNELIELIGILLIVVTFPYLVIFMIANFFRYERLYGKLEGYLIFENDKIIFDKIFYNISDIEKIEILNWDIKGDIVNVLFEFKPKKSNGVKNYVKLYLKNGKVETCYFLLTKSEKIQIFKEEFKVYFRKNLIKRQNYLNITEEY